MLNDVLLIGNGLNRCYYNDMAWGGLLEEIAKEHSITMNPNNTLPMEFECIVNQILKRTTSPSDTIYTDIKSSIVKRINSIKKTDNPLHKRFMNIPVHAVITTNYDYLLERAYDDTDSWEKACSKERQKGSSEKIHSINRYTTIKDRKFYHMHGELAEPESLCLGSVHYMRYVQEIEKSFNKGDTSISEKTDKKHIQTIMGSDIERNTWFDLFFNKNIHIVGLGLSLSEIDLWWVITYRSFLYFTDKFDARRNLKNRIYYYDIINNNENLSLKREKEVLKHNLTNQHVKYVPFHIENSNYKEGYEKICISIMNAIER